MWRWLERPGQALRASIDKVLGRLIRYRCHRRHDQRLSPQHHGVPVTRLGVYSLEVATNGTDGVLTIDDTTATWCLPSQTSARRLQSGHQPPRTSWAAIRLATWRWRAARADAPKLTPASTAHAGKHKPRTAQLPATQLSQALDLSARLGPVKLPLTLRKSAQSFERRKT
jgi:hypothetical protein